GRVIAGGSVEELARSVLAEETVRLEAGDPSPALTEALKNVPGVLRCETEGRILTVTSAMGSANLPRLLDCAAPYTILGVTTRRPTLEDAFLALTGKKLRDSGEGT
ncbi:MAG: export ABC transporter ATP-binding protein, partial [Clostridiales bacterium]|nr:export ABC transporter ATP-binding protein [Clostridiales bacterium]